MANPLTGDYNIVLQVSGNTINRLLATMHQNTDPQSELPHFPHSVIMRIGDPTPVDGMRGTAWAQLSVPRIDLIHGEDNRFNLEVGIRARYKPDPGTAPLPEFIDGTIRAQYRIDKIDPACFGWGTAAADYLWIRVVAPTVAFDGSAVDEGDPFTVVQPPDPAAIDARITGLATYLLKTRFRATPQKAEGRFRRGAMRSLNVGINRSAVAVPLAGQGQLTSINQEFLDGRDFGVAVSKAFIIGAIQPELDALVGWFDAVFRTRIVGKIAGIEAGSVSIAWRITLTSATADWWGGAVPLVGNVGVVTIKITGQMATSKSIYNLTFDVTQHVLLTFNSNEEFAATLIGLPTVNLQGPLAGLIGAGPKQDFAKAIEPFIKNEVNKISAGLSVKGRKTELVSQLQKLDASAGAFFDEAVFSPDGVVIRGQIAVSPRRAPVTELAKTPEQDGFEAFQSWIPGGRITSFDWTWSWLNSNKPGGSESAADRFLLRRPGGTYRTRFGMVKDLSRPLPVLDGLGNMCLTIKGEYVDAITGALVPVVAGRKCLRAGFDIRIQGVAGGRVFLRDWMKWQRDPVGPVQEVSLIDVGGGRTDHAPNTLVVRAGERWNPEIGMALHDALLNCRRVDAGMQILLLFKDGTLTSNANPLEEVSRLAADLEAPLMVNEDVRGSWSAALWMDSRSDDVQWRLVTPTGGVSWARNGPIEARELARVLDDNLLSAPPPSAQPLLHKVTPGTRIVASIFETDLFDRIADAIAIEDPCPPPIGPYSEHALAVFVQEDSAASQAALRRLADAREEDRPFIAVIVDGATDREFERLKDRLPEGAAAIADPDGAIASRFGIRTWPTSVTVRDGAVTAVDVGSWPSLSSNPEAGS
jgi:hypothetical protein